MIENGPMDEIEVNNMTSLLPPAAHGPGPTGVYIPGIGTAATTGAIWAGGWGLLNEYDRWACVRRLPSLLRKAMEDRPRLVFVAGGYIRSCVNGEPINDIDVFVSTEDEARRLGEALAAPEKPHQTPNSWTLTLAGHHVQIIHRWTFARPQDCVGSFDFTIARSALWFDGRWHTICDSRFYQDLAAKRLVYMSPFRNEDAGGSILRVLKFYTRGYRIPLDSMGAVVARLVTGVKDPERLTEAELAKIITGLLREVDPLIDPFASAHIDTPGEL